jgi:3-phosphoshikimate 1-carboxyvinyltransferase
MITQRPEPQPWPALHTSGPVEATVRMPGSKSLTNRALVLASLARTPTTIVDPLRSRDTELMAAGLRNLGATVLDQGWDWQVVPGPLTGPAHIDVGNAGTVMRFLLPVAGLAAGDIDFDGDPQARLRPLGPVIEALRALGVEITATEQSLPLTVHGRGWVLGGSVVVNASSSSQFVSALLLAAPRFADALEVRHRGGRLPSSSHVTMTATMLRRAGVLVENVDHYTWRVEPGPVALGRVRIEPDLSSAAPFLAAAVVTGGSVTVPGWPLESTQAGDALRHLLPAFGARSELHDRGLTVTGPERISAVDLDLGDVGELTPVLTAVAAFAEGPSRFRGIGHLRHHETDRLAALRTELTRLGGEVIEHPDGLEVRPRALHGDTFETYDDHRLAMAGAVIGLRVPGVVLSDVQTTIKTVPGFADLWAEMLG